MATNDDDLRQLLDMLRAEHRRLDAEIAALEADGVAPQLEVARLKKRKLMLKDEIAVIGDRIVPDIIA
ncbi:YdcH family protein [Sphingomonas mesophila]|uniref:YdcH family protein n=1 Tax=Sphingomonas mesophila TaxID=2303576 RepID=UPI000E58926F|nr:YdcH family protein [Sphingomonas mesophila]